MRKLLTLLLLAMVLIPLSAREYKIHFWQQNGTNYNTSVIGKVGSNWVLEVNGSDFDTWGVAGNDGKVYLLPFVVSESGQSNNYYKLGSYSEFTNSGDSKTYKKSDSNDSGLVLPSDYANKKFIFTISSNDTDGSDVTITVTWRDNVTTSSVYLLGTINSWKEPGNELTKDGSEYKLTLSKEDVEGALWQGDFYFRFIEHMSNSSNYTVVPKVDKTSLTVNGSYTSDTYATTNDKKEYYWKFTPTGANNYTIYFKNDNGTRSVKVTDDRPKWYLHSNLGGANRWGGETPYALTYNYSTGYYERSFTEAEINSGINGQEMRFRIYDGNNSWGPQVKTYVFDNTGSESYTSTTNSTENYFYIPKDFVSAKIEAKPVTGGILVNVTLVYDVNYYWVSPEITNGEKWEYFKMVPSRNRNQSGGGEGASDGKISKKYYTFTIKNEDLVTWKTKTKIKDDGNTTIHWYIVREDDGLAFRPTSDNPSPTEEKTSLSYTVGEGASAVTYTDDAVGYRNFMGYKDEGATRKGYFEFNKGYSDTSNSHSALAYTFIINDENGNVFFNYAHKPASTSIGYDLVGNFAGATSSVNIDIKNGKKMKAYYYKKDGSISEAVSDVSECDSIVYKVEVQKPANGWGNLYIDVNPHGNEDWSKVLRPLISLGNNLDGRALHGARTTAKSEQSLNPEPSDSYQSYTFSFNATTRTYKLEFNMPDATLSPGYENNEYVFDNSWGETIAVKYSNRTEHATAATKCYIVAGGSSAISLDGVAAKNKADLSSFNLTYDGKYIYMNGAQVATGNTVYIKIQGEDAKGNKGDVHLYQYTFNAKMSFEPRGGLFINSAKIKIEGGVPPYRYEIWHYNTKDENGETVIDYDTNPKKLSEGTFSNGGDYSYDADDNNYRISTPGFLKIIDAHGLEMSYDEVGGGFDFTYSTSENYKRNTTGAAITTVEPSNAGAYPNGADYWLAAPGDLTRLLSPTWHLKDSEGTKTANVVQPSWNGGDDNTIPLNTGNEIYQTVTDLAEGTYTVQAIVRGEAKPIYLKLNDTKKGEVLLTGDEAGAIASINKFGRCEHLENMQESTSNRAWHKLEGSATVSDGGNLTIAIRAEGRAYVDDVILLKDANDKNKIGFRTTASKSPDDTKCYDFRRRQVSGQPSQRQNNAYSFFDRGKNQNAVIFANNKTVIAMDKSLLAPECPNRDIDRRHPFNVVGTTEQDAGTGVAKALYLTDAGYDESDANCLPIGYVNSSKGNNSDAYRAHGYSFCPGLAFYAEDLIFDRDMSQMAVKKTTCMLPIAITPAQLKAYYGDNLKVYKFDNRSGNDLTFELQDDNTALHANEPYIFWNAEGKFDSRNGKTAGKTDGKFYIGGITSTNHNAASNHSGFPGTYAYMKVKRYGDASGAETDNINEAKETRFIYSAANGVFSVVSPKGANLKPFRAYFVIGVTDKANEARQLNIFFDDSIITGIDSVETTAPTSGDIYTIGGVLVAKDGNMSGLPKGIYIMNGKKYVVK